MHQPFGIVDTLTADELAMLRVLPEVPCLGVGGIRFAYSDRQPRLKKGGEWYKVVRRLIELGLADSPASERPKLYPFATELGMKARAQ